MEARLFHVATLAIVLVSMGASYRTQNFIVDAPSPQLAKEIGDAAERFRHDLAIEWTGKTMPPWSAPCMLTANVSPNLGAGGATSFVFERGEVFGWRMTIQGSRERILDSVLPHEITHTVFACHFRQALPRWADEGACTTVEHASERAKQQRMLITFLKTGRGISFSQMFAMKEYPSDILPLYSQGYSLARYLIAQGGKRKFLEFLATGMEDENWPRAIREHYGHESMLALQTTWLDWVRQGSPLDRLGTTALASATPTRRPRPQANLIYHAGREEKIAGAAGPLVPVRKPRPATVAARTDWRERGTVAGRSGSASSLAPNAYAQAAYEEPISSGAPQQLARPQPVEKARQIILEWDQASAYDRARK